MQYNSNPFKCNHRYLLGRKDQTNIRDINISQWGHVQVSFVTKDLSFLKRPLQLSLSWPNGVRTKKGV